MIFVPIPLPERVLQTSDCGNFFYADVRQTVLGMGMGMNVTAQVGTCGVQVSQGSDGVVGITRVTEDYHVRGHHNGLCTGIAVYYGGLHIAWQGIVKITLDPCRLA